jgi:hypothetical protein
MLGHVWIAPFSRRGCAVVYEDTIVSFDLGGVAFIQRVLLVCRAPHTACCKPTVRKPVTSWPTPSLPKHLVHLTRSCAASITQCTPRLDRLTQIRCFNQPCQRDEPGSLATSPPIWKPQPDTPPTAAEQGPRLALKDLKEPSC